MEFLLKATDLTVGRDGVPLLSGLSFALAPGQALILTGQNGAGKTTLLRSLAGFLTPLAGTVQTDEPAFAGHLDGVKAQLSVAENLSFWAEVHGTGSIDRALEQFDLQDLASRPARSLSAGQKRRLGLARLLLTGRQLWLLDEPTVSLDRHSVARFAQILRQHLGAGGAALIATHTQLGLDAPELDITPYRRSSQPMRQSAAIHPSHPDPAAKAQPRASVVTQTPATHQTETLPSGGRPQSSAKAQDPFGAGW